MRSVACALLVLTLQCLASQVDAKQRIVVEPERQLLVVYSTPAKRLANLALSDFNSGLRASVLAAEPLELFEIEAFDARQCMTSPSEKYRFSCLMDSTESVRKTSGARYLLIATGIASEAGDRATLLLIDLEKVKKAEGIAAAIEASPEDREDGYRKRAIAVTAAGGPFTRAQELRSFFDETVAGALAPHLRVAAQLQDYGSIEVRSTIPEVVVELDGRALGTLESTAAVDLVNVKAGAHTLRISGSTIETAEQTVVVAKQSVATVSVSPQLLNPPIYGWAYTTLLIAGSVLAVGGVVAAPFTTNDSACVREQMAPACDKALTWPGAVSLGVASMGASWAVGSLLFPDDTRVPWLEALVGLVVGGVVTAVLPKYKGPPALADEPSLMAQ